MKLRLDLHVHTSHSYDGCDAPAAMVEAARRAGLDGIAITDHNTTSGIAEAERAAGGLVVVPGVELSTARGHLLVLGVREPLPRGAPVEETIRLARERGGVIVAPHPFHLLRHSLGSLADMDIDAVEVFNSRHFTGAANARAERLARSAGVRQVGGSDAHSAAMVGYGVTEVETQERSVGAVLEALARGRTAAAGRRTPPSIYLRQVSRGLLRKRRGGGIGEAGAPRRRQTGRGHRRSRLRRRQT